MYDLLLVKERHIRAFNVRGSEYRLKTHPLPADVDYAEAYRIIHSTMEGEVNAIYT